MHVGRDHPRVPPQSPACKCYMYIAEIFLPKNVWSLVVRRLEGGSTGTVLADLRRKAPRSLSTRMNLVNFRLACCCG